MARTVLLCMKSLEFLFSQTDKCDLQDLSVLHVYLLSCNPIHGTLLVHLETGRVSQSIETRSLIARPSHSPANIAQAIYLFYSAKSWKSCCSIKINCTCKIFK